MTAVLLGVFAAVCWSFHDLMARSLAARSGPFRMALWIMLSGGVLLSLIVGWNGTIASASREGLGLGLILGVAYALGAAGLSQAVSYGPISVVGPLSAAYPVLVIAWGVLTGLTPTLLQWSAVAATLLGALVVARNSPEDGGIHSVEPGKLTWLIFYCALSGIGYSAAVIIGQKGAIAMGEFETAWVSRATAALTVLPFVLTEARRPALHPVHWLAMAAMGLLDVMGLVAINASGHFPGKEFAAVGISTYAAIAVLLAALVLRERVAPLQWLGIAMIVAGVATLGLGS